MALNPSLTASNTFHRAYLVQTRTASTTLQVRLYNFLAVERLSYATRARERIWRETRSSIRGRIPPLVISLVGIALGSMYGWLYPWR